MYDPSGMARGFDYGPHLALQNFVKNTKLH